MNAVEIKNGIYWVGAIDHNIRNFHGYIIPNGTTYNSYLITGEKNVLIDSVKSPFKDELLARITSVIDPSEIDVFIINHCEMDHSGSSEAVMKLAKDATVYSSKKGLEFLHKHYSSSKTWNIQIVDENTKLDIGGGRSLNFIPVPMLHWPDSMMTYLPEEHLLFSNDGFGQHIAPAQRFYDEIDDLDVMDEAKKYYANILMPFSSMALKKIPALESIEIDSICPSHGSIFRQKKDITKIIENYKSWAAGETLEKAVIVYDTMYSSTEKMARAIEEGLMSGGVDVKVFNLRVSDLSEVMKEVLDSAGLVVGSATLNNGFMPTVGAFLTYLEGLKPRGKLALSFGSYGWGGGAMKKINEALLNIGLNLVDDGYQLKFVPEADELKHCFELGREFANKIRRKS